MAKSEPPAPWKKPSGYSRMMLVRAREKGIIDELPLPKRHLTASGTHSRHIFIQRPMICLLFKGLLGTETSLRPRFRHVWWMISWKKRWRGCSSSLPIIDFDVLLWYLCMYNVSTKEAVYDQNTNQAWK